MFNKEFNLQKCVQDRIKQDHLNIFCTNQARMSINFFKPSNNQARLELPEKARILTPKSLRSRISSKSCSSLSLDHFRKKTLEKDTSIKLHLLNQSEIYKSECFKLIQKFLMENVISTQLKRQMKQHIAIPFKSQKTIKHRRTSMQRYTL